MSQYSEYYETITFPTDLKSQEEVDAAILKTVHSPVFAGRFANDDQQQCFLKFGEDGYKKTHQHSQYLNPDDMRFYFVFNKGEIDCMPDDDEYEISNPGDTMDYLAILIKNLISKKGRTCIISQTNSGDNEKIGLAIKHDSIHGLIFAPRVIIDGQIWPDLSDWMKGTHN